MLAKRRRGPMAVGEDGGDAMAMDYDDGLGGGGGYSSGCSSSSEDTSDDTYAARHRLMEEEERRRYAAVMAGGWAMAGTGGVRVMVCSSKELDSERTSHH